MTKSANESSCFPSSELTFNNLAISPSKKSNNAPQNINTEDATRFPSNANNIADNPQNKLVSVIIFGIFLFIVFISAKI